MVAGFASIFAIALCIISGTLGFSITTRQRTPHAVENEVTCWASPSSAGSETPLSNLGVRVFDNAFSASACGEIHDLTIDHNIRGNDGSSIFFRPPHNESALSPLENVIHSALTAMDDTSKTVEYWSREEYMNIDTHADIDEVELEDEGTLRCPEMAHVLYLKVREGIRGPTCVFPRKMVGWDMDKNNGDKVDLVTVPAVQGRILRFPGSAMHAVPLPAHRWLLTDEEEKALRLEEKDEANDEDLFDENEEYLEGGCEEDNGNFEEEAERSVLLFNAWPDDGPPPRGINRDYATGALPDGIEIDEDSDYVSSQEAQRRKEWEEDYGVDAEQICCNPRLEWDEAAVIRQDPQDEETTETKVRVNLMGKQMRRVHPKKTALLKGPVEKLRLALEERTAVTSFHFAQEKKQ